MIPPTRYIDAGPGVTLASPQAAMVQGKAYANMGETIAAIGSKGFEIAEKVRKIDEGAKIAEFFQKKDLEAAGFSNDLMRRSDTEQWPQDWKSKAATMQDELRNMGLSPEGQSRAEMAFGQWNTERTINYETQAASKTVAMGRAKFTNAATHHFSRGEVDKGKQILKEGGDLGLFNPVEVEQGFRLGDEVAAEVALDEDIQMDPQGTLARLDSGEFLESEPGADLQLVERGKRQASARIEDFRGAEMDKLEAKLSERKLKPLDVEAAQFLTDEDRQALIGAMGKMDPPSNEDHAKAWKALDLLREARQDPALSDDLYRKVWNESRGLVLLAIPPQWQGDLKKELSYLSPAGRAPDREKTGSYQKADLEAVGRDIAFRARDAGFFGKLADDAPPAEREKAYRKAEDIRLETKRWIASQRGEVTPEQVREFTDGLISGDRIKATANDLFQFIPGSGQRLRPKAPATMPPLPPKQGTKDKKADDPLQIPPGNGSESDSVLPARKQLETFIK